MDTANASSIQHSIVLDKPEMKIESAKITNYKSYRETEALTFTDGFNVIVGQNNVGKTALIEALSLKFTGNPHKNLALKPGVLNPTSSVEVAVSIEAAELQELLLRNMNTLYLPLADRSHDAVIANSIYRQMVTSPSLQFTYLVGAQKDQHSNARALGSTIRTLCQTPQDLGGGDSLRLAELAPLPDRSGFVFRSMVHANDSSSVDHQLFGLVSQTIYTFRAERLNVGACNSGTNEVLMPDASNLPEVLHNLQARNGPRFDRLIGYIRQIFPSINLVSIIPVSGNRLEIVTWTCDPSSERADLTIPLAHSGTGLGQALAILYVAITSNYPRAIIIDEPNSFLHPSASRKLIEILRNNFEPHQFIITTHSPEIIRAAASKSLKLIKWSPPESKIEQFGSVKLAEIGNCLAEVGAKLSDVFGADKILWVEGPTEETAFNALLERGMLHTDSSLNIVAVKNTGDFDRKNKRIELIIDIYRKLSEGNALMPPAVGFVFDREDLNDTNIQDIRRRTDGLVSFLPRRMYENYLLCPAAIAAVMNSTPNFSDMPITGAMIEDWMRKNCGEYTYDTEDWKTKVHAANLLKGLFEETSSTAQTYDKVRHGKALTEWIIENRSGELSDLIAFLNSITSS